jgi:lysophospholipase L1-like esterase
MRIAMLAVFCLALVGCVVKDINGDGKTLLACYGDSNTIGLPAAGPSWCDDLKQQVVLFNWQVTNYGWPGVSGVNENPSGQPPCGGLLPFGGPGCSLGWVEYAVSGGTPPFNPYLGAADVVMLAYGTNDVAVNVQQYGDAAITVLPPRLIQAYRDDIAALPTGTLVFVALIPPFYQYPGRTWDPRWNQVVVAINTLIKATWPANRIIDLYSGYVPADYSDNVHFVASGQQKRATAAYNALINS